MYTNLMEFEVHLEQKKEDLLREAERERLIRVAGLQGSNSWQHVAHWIGARMVEWGLRLQNQSQISPVCCA